MRAVVLDGAEEGDPVLRRVRGIVEAELRGLKWEVSAFSLHGMDVAPCRGCFSCWTATPGRCAVSDDAEIVLKAVVPSDLAVFLTPVTFGGYNALLKNAVDRMLPLLSPFFLRRDGVFLQRSRYARNPRLLGIGVLSAPDMESVRVFTTQVHQNAEKLDSPARAALVLSSRHGSDLLAENVRNALTRVEIAR